MEEIHLFIHLTLLKLLWKLYLYGEDVIGQRLNPLVQCREGFAFQ